MNMRLFKFRKSDLTDEDLMVSLKAGDQGAFKDLFDRYALGIYNYYTQRLAQKEAAEDLTQECFMRLWEKAHLYRPEHSFKVWFWTLVRNKLNDHWRGVYREPDFNELPDIVVNEDELGRLIEKEDQERVKKVFDSLSQGHKDYLSLWLQDLTYEEMSGITGKSLDAVKSVLKRAKQEFQKNWKE